MKTFLEFMGSIPTKREMSDEEVKLLLMARDRIINSDLAQGLVDRTGNQENPHFWVQIPEAEGGGGVLVYVIFECLTIRYQANPKGIPSGPATKVTALKKDDEPEDGIDLSGVPRLYGAIKKIANLVKKLNVQGDVKIQMQNDPSQFKSFWPDSKKKPKKSE